MPRGNPALVVLLLLPGSAARALSLWSSVSNFLILVPSPAIALFCFLILPGLVPCTSSSSEL